MLSFTTYLDYVVNVPYKCTAKKKGACSLTYRPNLIVNMKVLKSITLLKTPYSVKIGGLLHLRGYYV